MNNPITTYFDFLGLLFRKGKLRHSGTTINQTRESALVDFMEFVPHKPLLKKKNAKYHFFKNSVTQNLYNQAAYYKDSIKLKGGHLTVEAEKISYIRIPKSASTSISQELLEKMYQTLKQKALNEKQINFLTDVNLHTWVTESGDEQTYFTVVRNPFSRLVSVYRDFFENNSTEFIYRDYLFGILHQNISFTEFVDRIALIPDLLKDQHIKPQHLFLKYYEKQNITFHIFKLEEPERLQTFLNSNGMQLRHLNKSVGRYNYQDYYTLSSLQKVHSIYQVDIETFGYKNTYHQLAEQLTNSQHKTVQI